MLQPPFLSKRVRKGASTALSESRRVHMVAIHWHATRDRPSQRNALLALSDAGNHVVATLRVWRRRSRDRSRLAELDDRMLKDIGLTRTDAEFLINKPFWRE